jgi:A/G-specific adenine glycosylase
MTLAGGQARTKDKSRKSAGARPSGPQAQALLAWYDRHRRRLPWRAENGERPDPYRVWLSEIMLQQTSVKAVAPYYARFLTRWPSLQHLASVRLVEVLKLWAGLGYYARARNLHACARTIVARHGGAFPQSELELRTLPGIGGYTAAAIAAIAFDQKATPVDGNIERVVARLFAVEEALPAGKPRIKVLAQMLTPARRAGDFAQAMMDLGASICTPKRPACALCPWRDDCVARLRGDPETFPRKAPKVQGELRRGAAFVALRADGAVLVRTRPQKGLLGGMSEVPTTQWSQDFDELNALSEPPLPAHWRKLPGRVTHTFTHFPLELTIYTASIQRGTKPPAGARWIPLRQLAGEALPSVMRKVIAHALE